MGKYLALTIILSYFTLFVINIIATEENGHDVFNLENAISIYKDFIKRYNRTFENDNDYYQRYLNFVKTLRTINTNNKQATIKQKVLPNKYADWSDEERKKLLSKPKISNRIDPDLQSYSNLNDDSLRPNSRFELALPGTAAYKRLMGQKKAGRTFGYMKRRFTRNLY